MASRSSGNARLLVVAIVASFIGGCWIGMGSEDGGDAYCVVTPASAPSRPEYAPGQLVVRTGDDCQAGEPTVCGTFEPETGDNRQFVSNECADD
jgi:hypothetical protein